MQIIVKDLIKKLEKFDPYLPVSLLNYDSNGDRQYVLPTVIEEQHIESDGIHAVIIY